MRDQGQPVNGWDMKDFPKEQPDTSIMTEMFEIGEKNSTHLKQT